MLVTAYAESKDKKDTGLGGKWATDPVATAKPPVKSNTITDKLIKGTTEVVTQQAPGTGRGPGRMGSTGPGRMGPGGGPVIDTSSAKIIEKGSSPDGLALILELQLDKTKLKGKVSEVTTGLSYPIEESKVTGTQFEFTTYKKVGSVKVPTVYKGELTDEKTVSLSRFLISGKPVDPDDDGAATMLVFRRMPK